MIVTETNSLQKLVPANLVTVTNDLLISYTLYTKRDHALESYVKLPIIEQSYAKLANHLAFCCKNPCRSLLAA